MIGKIGKVLIDGYSTEAGEKVALSEDFVAARLAEMFLPEEL